MKLSVTVILILILSSNCFCQEYYQFRKEESATKGLSLTPILGITIKPEGGSALAGIMKVDFTFSKFISAGIAYAYLPQPSNSYVYFYQSAYPEHSGFITVGGQYPFDNGWLSIGGTAGLGYIFSRASTISSYFDLGLGFKVHPRIIIKPELIFVQDWPIFGLGTKLKL